MTTPTLSIDPSAIADNVRLIAGRTDAALMAVVKADGYGAGATTAARAALGAGATWLGVTSIAEALALRADGVEAPVLSWLNPADADFAAAVAADVDLAVPGLEHLRAIAAAGPARVHLQLDCGLARDGAPAALWPELCWRAARLERAGAIRVVGLMGHLSSASTPADQANGRESAVFDWGVRVALGNGLAPQHRHLAATAATLTAPATHHTLVRVGAGLVGIDPSGTTRLRGALTLTAPVIAARELAAGAAVGYDHTWTAPRPTRVAAIPVGYADGIPRAAGNRAQVLIAGHRLPVVGAVSMDQLVVDLGDAPVALGDTATVFGPGDDGEPTVDDWARWSGTIPHEIVTGIGPRVERVVRERVAS